MKKNILFLGLLSTCFSHISFAQKEEMVDFDQKKNKTFFSKGHKKSQGLVFSIDYPSSYILHDVTNEYMIKGFVHKSNLLAYMVGVSKNPTHINKVDAELILSEENFKRSVKQTTGNDQVFLNYVNGFKIRGLNAAYLDYMANVTVDIKSYIRQYFIIYRNYLITLSFTFPNLANKSLEETRKAFENYKPFFSLVTNSLVIQSQ